LPEADLLGGTVIGAPVAPFIAPSASLSTDPSSELLPSARTISDIGSLGMQGIDKGSIGLLGRKRASDIQEDKQNNILPEKWRKTPVGSVPYSPTPISPIGTTISADVSALSPKFFESLTTDSNRPKRGRAKSVKRRKSFDECGTTDEPVTPHSVTSLSSSAPSLDSYILHSAISGAKPFSMLKDYVLSPSSSTSSIFDAASLEDFPQAPVNVMTDDYTKFICSELKAELLDPNREGYEVLPMEEFDWDRNATCIIGSYLESYVDLLDEYFKEAMDAELENDGLCTSDAGSEQPKKSKQDPFVPSPGDITDRDSSDVSHDFESQGHSSSMHSQWGSTRSIKDAAWYYSLRSLNIYDDDFRYSDIKRHLDKGTRRYIKRVCVRPDLVTAADWLGVQTMKNEEKCRIGLLSCQARFLGEALWGIKGVSNFLC